MLASLLSVLCLFSSPLPSGRVGVIKMPRWAVVIGGLIGLSFALPVLTVAVEVFIAYGWLIILGVVALTVVGSEIEHLVQARSRRSRTMRRIR